MPVEAYRHDASCGRVGCSAKASCRASWSTPAPGMPLPRAVTPCIPKSYSFTNSSSCGNAPKRTGACTQHAAVYQLTAGLACSGASGPLRSVIHTRDIDYGSGRLILPKRCACCTRFLRSRHAVPFGSVRLGAQLRSVRGACTAAAACRRNASNATSLAGHIRVPSSSVSVSSDALFSAAHANFLRLHA